MEIYFDLASLLITLCLVAGIFWQTRYIRSTNNSLVTCKEENAILKNKNKNLEDKVETLNKNNKNKTEELRRANENIISMTKALEEFKKSFKVK